MAASMRCHVSAPRTAGQVGEGDLAIIGPDGEVQPCAACRHERPSSRGLTGGRGAHGGVQVFFEGNEDGGEQIRFVPEVVVYGTPGHACIDGDSGQRRRGEPGPGEETSSAVEQGAAGLRGVDGGSSWHS